MIKEQKVTRTLSPIVVMITLILLLSLGSSLLSILNLDSNKTSIINGNLETSIIVVKNVFTKEGLIHFFNNIITNFNLLKSLTLIILSLIAASIGKNSGLFKHLFSPLKKMKFSVLTFLVVLISVLSTIIGDYSYIILLPLVAVLYEHLEKNPVLGILTVFLGISLGYGTGIAYNYNNYSLGLLTQISASISVDTAYKYNLHSNLYIMLFSSLLISYLITVLVNKYLVKKLSNPEPYSDDLNISLKALITSILIGLGCILLVIYLIVPKFNGLLLNNGEERFVAQLFSSNAPFYESFVFIYLLIITICSVIYGFISKNFKTSHDFSFGLTKDINNIGYLFIMLFLYSILLGILDWTNIGVFITNKLITLLTVLNFTGLPLIIISFIFVILMSLLLPNAIEKWSLISPLMIPLFMRANISPDFTQFIFMVADGVGKSLTPVFIYFIIMIGLIKKYNKGDKVSLFGTIKLSLPIILTTTLLWILILIICYISGIPLGIETYATM